jgi:hypothetical protein
VARIEQLARQSVHADAAALYMVDASSKRMVTLTPQEGYDSVEHFRICESNTAWSVLRGRAWRAVCSVLPSRVSIFTLLAIAVSLL